MHIYIYILYDFDVVMKQGIIFYFMGHTLKTIKVNFLDSEKN